MGMWPPRADDVFRYLYGILSQVNPCNWLPVGISASTLVNRATNPSIYNVWMPLQDAEYSQALPAGVKKFLMHTQDGTEFRVAFGTGFVAVPTPPIFTAPTNSAYNEDLLEAPNLSLFFAGVCPGLTMEIIAWT